MANMFGDGLSLRVTAQTRDFQRDVENASDKLRSFGGSALSILGPLQALQGRADEAGDEIADVDREAGQASRSLLSLGGAAGIASGGMATFGISTESAGFAVRGLSGSIILTLIPALAVLGATLVPIVAALGGFLAIAGSFAGIALVGLIGALATDMDFFKTLLTQIANRLETAFAPAIDLAKEVLLIFAEEFLDIIPALVPAEDTMHRIAGAFADLGSILIASLPAFVDLATTLTSEFLPPFNEWLRDILPDLPGMIMAMVDAADRMLPKFMEAGGILRRMLPQLLEFGFAALRVVGPALADLANAVTGVIEQFNGLDGSTQNLITRGALLAPVLTTVISLLGGISLPILAVIGAIALLWKAWETNFGNIRGVVEDVWGRLKSVLGENLPTLIDNTKKIIAALLPVIEPIFNAILQLVGVGVVNAFDSLVSVLTAISQVLTGDFAGAWETIEGLIGRVIDRHIDLINRFTGGFLEDAINRIIDFVNKFGNVVESGLEAIGQGDKFQFEELSRVDLGTAPLQGQPGNTPQRSGSPRAGDITINVTGDTGVIEDVSVETVDRRFAETERRNNRRTGPTVNR